MALASCTHRPTVQPQPEKFVIGDPYQSGGEWRYPRSFNSYDVTGLSTVIGGDHATYTSDGNTYDSNALAAASPVLQLPAIATVTNLVNGRSLDVMVNDRGPDQPGRIIAVTPRVARLLDYPSGGTVEVEVTLKPQQTAALDEALGQGPKLTAAPEATIQAQSLAPPGTAQAQGPLQNLTPTASAAPSGDPAQVSGEVTLVPPSPGPLFVQIPGFGRLRDAQRMADRLYGMQSQIVPVFGGDRTLFAVNVGPYHTVEDADAALRQILARSITDPEILVR